MSQATGLWRAGARMAALSAVLLLLFGGADAAFAGEPPAFPAPAPEDEQPPADDVPPVELVEPDEPTGVAGPAPDVRERPPEPPAPGASIPDWDLDHLNADLKPVAPPRPDPFSIRDIRFRHDNRTASADGRIAPLRRIPQWVDVIERHELEEWRPLEIGTLATRFPNVSMADGGNPFLQIPIIRGLGRDRVKILTDGVWPGTQALGSQGGTLSLWDPESTERVEIYHGPGAYLKAIDSPGGFINIVPRRPRQHGSFSADGRVTSSFSSATRTWRNRGEVDFGEGRVAALAGVTWTTHDDRDTGGGTLDPTGYEQLSADLALDYFLGPRSRLGLTVQFSQADSIDSPLQTGSVSKPGYDRVFIGLSLSSVNIGPMFHGHRISISLDSFLEDDDQLNSAQNAGIGNNDDVKRYDFSLQGNLYLLCCHDTWAELHVGYAKLDRDETLLCVPTAPGVPGNPLIDGDDVIRKVGEGFSTNADLSNCPPVTRSVEAEELIVTGILEDQYHQECWDIYAGVRLDYFRVEDSFGREEEELLVSGAVGIAQHLNKRQTVYGNASVGFRRPTLFERNATELVDGVVVFGNPDLDPELHANLEVGVKSSYRNRLSFQAAAFGHYIDDTITGIDLGAGFEQLRNGGDVLLYGLEATGAWRPFPTYEGLEAFASVGFTLSSDEDLVPDHPFQWRTGARYSVPAPKGYRVRRWFAEAALYGASESREGITGGGSYVSADLLFGGYLDLGCWDVVKANLGITNLFDQDYTLAGSALAAPGLSLIAGFSVDF
ncbi:MAG: TonB-dependent receptor [Planctomycetota bacterium]|nr:TonB-dependent receptor [Planctomycetota bacterium]